MQGLYDEGEAVALDDLGGPGGPGRQFGPGGQGGPIGSGGYEAKYV